MNSIQETPNPSNPFNDPQNPFADPEKGMALSVLGPAQTPDQAAALSVGPPGASGMSFGSGGIASGPTATATLLTSDKRESRNGPPSPRGPGFNGAPSPVVAQGPGAESPGGNVYRVQMDFSPSMKDELELKVDQLVRLLHEYDDGWVSIHIS